MNVDPLDDLFLELPSQRDSEGLDNEVRRIRDGSMLAFKVEFAISQSYEIERENASLARNLELKHHYDNSQQNTRESVKEAMASIDLGQEDHLDSDSEGPDEDYTPEDTEFRVENPNQFLRRMPDLKYAESDISLVQASQPDGVVKDVHCTILQPKYTSNDASDEKLLSAS